MPKKKGGKKKPFQQAKRHILYKEDDQIYAQIIKNMGDRRFECLCFDGETRICHIRGKMRKRVWIKVDDIVLVTLREFQSEKGDIIHKYNPDEVRTLRKKGEIPELAGNMNEGEDDDGLTIVFEEEKEDEVDFDNI
jgi:translation initiation factor 1A